MSIFNVKTNTKTFIIILNELKQLVLTVYYLMLKHDILLKRQ
jgi:hypothetical protein